MDNLSPNCLPTLPKRRRQNKHPVATKIKSKSIQKIPEGKVAGTSNDRLFYALPNFLTLQGRQKLPPVSTKDKFKVVALRTAKRTAVVC
jgi:hypothetical protein